MKKITAIVLLCLTFILGVGGIAASASFGSGITVIANEIQLVKTGLLGKKLRFSDIDFKCTFNVDDFESIKITKLPSTQEGTLLLAGRRINEGQTIKRKNINALVFIPASSEITSANFKFILCGKGIECETNCTMKFIDKINYAPEAPDEETASLSFTTQSDISLFGSMSVTDPEGDELEYMIVDYPKSGSITLTDKKSGSYRYTPADGFTGYDSFSYVARDCYGNYSEPISVSIKTVARMSSQVYNDMTDRAEYNAAVAMTAMGVMNGKTLGDGSYFCPDEEVTKAEFVAMAMKTYGLKADSSLKSSFFDDNDKIPSALLGYVATAQLLGIIDGEYTEAGLIFNPNDKITLYQAASIISKVLGIEGETEDNIYFDNDTIPIYAKSDVNAMFTLGIFDGDREDFNGGAILTRANAAEYLYKMIKA